MLKDLPKKTQEKLREHAKLHRGGLRGRHMRNMVRFMSQGDTFAKAHNKAKKLDSMMKSKSMY
tara:strand:+ start:544 stop:732 length:189 start_codon:yes stop_codon:yes gene_type:complete